MRFDSNGKLAVVDAYYGLFRVDVDSGKYFCHIITKKPLFCGLVTAVGFPSEAVSNDYLLLFLAI